jgi:hypothetical protein
MFFLIGITPFARDLSRDIEVDQLIVLQVLRDILFNRDAKDGVNQPEPV